MLSALLVTLLVRILLAGLAGLAWLTRLALLAGLALLLAGLLARLGLVLLPLLLILLARLVLVRHVMSSVGRGYPSLIGTHRRHHRSAEKPQFQRFLGMSAKGWKSGHAQFCGCKISPRNLLPRAANA
jgi:hypothetical protein